MKQDAVRLTSHSFKFLGQQSSGITSSLFYGVLYTELLNLLMSVLCLNSQCTLLQLHCESVFVLFTVSNSFHFNPQKPISLRKMQIRSTLFLRIRCCFLHLFSKSTTQVKVLQRYSYSELYQQFETLHFHSRTDRDEGCVVLVKVDYGLLKQILYKESQMKQVF